MIAGYDPGSGRRIWSANCLTMATCGTCVWTDGIVIASALIQRLEETEPDAQPDCVKTFLQPISDCLE